MSAAAPAGEFVTVARVEEIPAGQMKYVDVRGVPVALCNVEGHMFAVGNLCTHDDGPLSGGSLDGYAIECPRHGARFDVRNGRVLCLPAAVPIPSYPVKIQDGQVLVSVGAGGSHA